jgi:aryl sulfotransferase
MPTLLRPATREYRTPIQDSHHWDNYRPRSGDIIVATYPKCGTTWTQRIVDMLIHQSTAPRAIMEAYPWLDATFFGPIEAMLARLEAQTHRRSIKSHLPFDSLPLYDGVKYVHVARDGRDACFSMHNHQLGFTGFAKESRAEAAKASGQSAAPPSTPDDPREYYLQWIADAETGGSAFRQLPFFEFEMTYWSERTRPNVLLVHYNDLKADLEGEIRRISAFLEIDTPDSLLSEMSNAARFETMRADGEALLPGINERFDHGHLRFLNKGTNGRWRDVLSEEDLARYAALVEQRLPPALANWIEHGRVTAGEPRNVRD